MSSIRLIFLPYSANNNNPYQDQLSNHLEEIGIKVEGSKSNDFFSLLAFNRSQPQILHLHWLHSFFTKTTFIKSLLSSIVFLCQLIILRLLGIRIVWTVHNLKNHNNKYIRLDYICTKIVAKLSHAVIAHCEKAKEEIISTFSLSNCDKVFVVPHGNYVNCYENKVSREQARHTLGISESTTVVLFFGLIRLYKGVLELIGTFNQLSVKEAKLIIVGKVWNDNLGQGELLKQKALENGHIDFIPGFVPDEKIQLYMNACDVVVFPYRDILTSGAVLLAMSFGKACIAPNIGCIGEVLDSGGAFLYNPESEEGLSRAIKESIEHRSKLISMGEYNRGLAEQYDWGTIARMTHDAYKYSLAS